MSEEYKGGEQGYGGDGPNVRLDDFVGRIVQDPSQPPELLLLSGYLGASSEEGHVRLYLDEELSRYVEIHLNSIRHTQELPADQSPLGGSLVWLDRSAEVLHGSAGGERRKATFLEGQIAQDFIGAAGGYDTGGEAGAAGPRVTRTVDCEAAAAPTRLLGCQSAINPCIPQTEFGPNCQSRFQICNTLTGIFCTRFGPGCRRTLFEPACTSFGPNCRTVFINQCPSLLFPCVTQDRAICQESGFVPCNPPFDPTIWQQQGAPQPEAFAGPGGGGFGGGGFGGGVFQTGFNCPSVFDNCATRESFCPSRISFCPTEPIICRTQPAVCQTSFNNPCPSINVRCGSQAFACPPTNFGPPCQFETAINCPTFDIRCQTRSGPRCLISRFAVCGVTRDCTFQTARCGFDQGGGGGIEPVGDETRFCPTQSSACGTAVGCFPIGGGGAQGFGAEAFGAQPPEGGAAGLDVGKTEQPVCYQIKTQQVVCFESQFIRCASQLDACPTRFNCPSRVVACQSQFVRCPSALDACPTRFNCPSVTSPCVTQDFSCETRGRCPSAVDACPTRFGCFDTQVCGESRACFPGGGGGGFNPGGGGGGGGVGFNPAGGAAGVAGNLGGRERGMGADRPPQPQQFRGGAVAAIQTRAGCSPSQSVRCPSSVDACPTRVGCSEGQGASQWLSYCQMTQYKPCDTQQSGTCETEFEGGCSRLEGSCYQLPLETPYFGGNPVGDNYTPYLRTQDFQGWEQRGRPWQYCGVGGNPTYFQHQGVKQGGGYGQKPGYQKVGQYGAGIHACGVGGNPTAGYYDKSPYNYGLRFPIPEGGGF
ncbi:MAG TPA: hypothetical protein VFZ44_06485 [Pyrinomonadaceae bacterium]